MGSFDEGLIYVRDYPGLKVDYEGLEDALIILKNGLALSADQLLTSFLLKIR